MADVVNRTTKELRVSVNTPDFPTISWIVNPDLSTFAAIGGYQAQYANINGDLVTLMSPSEREAVDIAAEDSTIDSNRTVASDRPETASNIPTGFEGIEFRALIELLNKRDNFVINRLEELQTTFDDIKATVGAADSIRAAIPANFLATNTRTRRDAILDYQANIAEGGADGDRSITVPKGDVILTGQVPAVA